MQLEMELHPLPRTVMPALVITEDVPLMQCLDVN